MSNFGNLNLGFFVGGTSGGGGGTSTGVNGLNGTTNIGLGGSLTTFTQILGGGNSFELSNCFNMEFVLNSGGISSNLSLKADLIRTTFNDGVISAQEGFNLDFSVRQYIFGGTDATINCDSVNQKIIFNTKGLQLDSITLNSSATTVSVSSIPITINSTQFYINLST